MAAATDRPWTEPEDLRAELVRTWERGGILRATLADGDPVFPLRLRVRGPRRAELAARFAEVRSWIARWEETLRGRAGCAIEWEPFVHPVLGANTLPAAVTVATADDAAAWIGKKRELDRFRRIVSQTGHAGIALQPWLARRPLAALEHAERWADLLSALAWFRDHPRSGLYLREVDLVGADTKFLESHRGLLAELLDTLQPEDAAAPGPHALERRLGLATKPSLLRVRILDPAHHVAGLSDLSAPDAQLAALPFAGIRRVFVLENEINGLTFPACADAVAVFGLGYAVDRLAGVPWLADRALHYWGDLDTHGFAMLDRLRAHHPHARSFLMDRATLEAHRDQWVTEARQHPGGLTRLDAAEHALFEDLRSNRMGPCVRLEQERVRFGCVRETVARIAGV